MADLPKLGHIEHDVPLLDAADERRRLFQPLCELALRKAAFLPKMEEQVLKDFLFL